MDENSYKDLEKIMCNLPWRRRERSNVVFKKNQKRNVTISVVIHFKYFLDRVELVTKIFCFDL